MDECRYKENNNGRCKFCKKFGHKEHDCWFNEEKEKIIKTKSNETQKNKQKVTSPTDEGGVEDKEMANLFLQAMQLMKENDANVIPKKHGNADSEFEINSDAPGNESAVTPDTLGRKGKIPCNIKKRRSCRSRRRRKKIPKKDKLKLGHMNIRGIKGKIKDINSLIEEEDLDILVFTETKLKQKESRKIKGYKEYFLNRETSAGGVLIFVRKDLESKVIKRNPECETLWLKISGKDNEDVIIGGTYSPCENTITKKEAEAFVNTLEEDYLETMENESKAIIMVGDYNAHMGNDKQGIEGNHAKIGINGKEYRRFISENNLVLMNSEKICEGKWTRYLGDKRSILDLTIVAETLKDKIIKMEIDENKHTIESKKAPTDHKLTIVELDLSVKRKDHTKLITLYDSDKWNEYKKDLKEIVKEIDEEKEIYPQVTEKIKKAAHKVIKKRKVKIGQGRKLMGYNDEIKNEIKIRRQLCRAWKIETNEERKQKLKEEYERKRDDVKLLMEKTEAEEIETMIERRTGKEKLLFWKTIKSIRRNDYKPERVLNDKNEVVEEEQEVVNIKSKYYENLYKKDKQSDELKTEEENFLKNLEEAMEDQMANEEEYNQEFTAEEIHDAISKTKNNKAAGPDEITYEMLKHGESTLNPLLTKCFNKVLMGENGKPEDWDLGELISFYKGKGREVDLKNQRGITLTSCVLKCLEKAITNRIDPLIKQNSTDLQGGGKSDEAVEEYLLMLHTAIAINQTRKKQTILIITDVEKAFDKAWRVGVFKNLMDRGIRGRLLKLIWSINNDLKTRIKGNIHNSEYFEVEGSLRQGGGLSASLYAQHASKIVEELESGETGVQMGKEKLTAIAWQDDITGIASSEEEAVEVTRTLQKSSEKNRVQFSKDDKCKTLRVRNKKWKRNGKEHEHHIGEIKLENVREAKILGFYFNEENNCSSHIEKKEKEVKAMMANLCLTVNSNGMGKMFLQTMMTLYSHCFLPKLIYGMAATTITECEIERLEVMNRKILKDFLSLPQSTPNIAIYHEFNVLPIEVEIWKRKLITWYRISRRESNEMIRETRKELIVRDLPWARQLAGISQKIGIDLLAAKKLSKHQWKHLIKGKIHTWLMNYLTTEIAKTNRYKENIEEDIRAERKVYFVLPRKLAEAVCRGRCDLLDPTPRRPFGDPRWECGLCKERSQSSRHYILECSGTTVDFTHGMSREELWEAMRKGGDDNDVWNMARTLLSIYKHINEH